MDETIDNQQRNLFTKGYIAGLLDGEGTITIVRNGKCKTPPFYTKLSPYVSIANTNETIIDKTASSLKALDVPHYIRTLKRKKYRPSYTIVIEGLGRFDKLYNAISDCEFAKKELLELVQAFAQSRLPKKDLHPSQSAYTEEEIQLYNAVRIYNERGGKSRYTFKAFDPKKSQDIQYQYHFNEMKKLVEQGKPVGEIAKIMNLHQSSVSKWIKRNSQRLQSGD